MSFSPTQTGAPLTFLRWGLSLSPKLAFGQTGQTVKPLEATCFCFSAPLGWAFCVCPEDPNSGPYAYAANISLTETSPSYLSISVHLSVYLSVYPSIYLSYLFIICLYGLSIISISSIYLSIYLPIIYLSISIYLLSISVLSSIYPSIYLLYLSIYLSLFIFHSF